MTDGRINWNAAFESTGSAQVVVARNDLRIFFGKSLLCMLKGASCRVLESDEFYTRLATPVGERFVLTEVAEELFFVLNLN